MLYSSNSVSVTLMSAVSDILLTAAGEALDVSLLDNVAAAEEYDDDEPELRFTEDGIPIEPFNLLSEKGEGYFDEDGNFLFYRQETEDAWVDSLPGMLSFPLPVS